MPRSIADASKLVRKELQAGLGQRVPTGTERYAGRHCACTRWSMVLYTDAAGSPQIDDAVLQLLSHFFTFMFQGSQHTPPVEGQTAFKLIGFINETN